MTAKKKTTETIVEAKAPTLYFKGFDKDLKCREYQFEIGKTYTHDGPIEICKSGFHACANPLDVLNYYGLWESRFAAVELGGNIEAHSDDTKACAASITIKAELKLPEFVQAAVKWVFDACKSAPEGGRATVSNERDSKLAASGDSSQLAASGHYSQLEVTGDDGVIASSSRRSVAKGKAGTWIVLAEFNDDHKCIGFAIGRAGYDGIPADTWLRASGGKLVEA